jgi:hypothetical protein
MLLEPIMHKIRANESGAAGDEKSCHADWLCLGHE